MSLTKLFQGRNNYVIYKLFPHVIYKLSQPKESLVSDIPARDGNIEILFLRFKVQYSKMLAEMVQCIDDSRRFSQYHNLTMCLKMSFS